MPSTVLKSISATVNPHHDPKRQLLFLTSFYRWGPFDFLSCTTYPSPGKELSLAADSNVKTSPLHLLCMLVVAGFLTCIVSRKTHGSPKSRFCSYVTGGDSKFQENKAYAPCIGLCWVLGVLRCVTQGPCSQRHF